MQITSKGKGLIAYPGNDDEYYEALIAEDSQLTAEDYAAMEAQSRETLQILEENEKINKAWEANGSLNFKQLRELQKDGQTRGTNYIGERVAYLRKISDMQPADVYTSAGIAKSTLYRIEEGKNIPTEKVIVNVLYALQTSLADFSCFPDDFEKWKASISNTGSSTNIYRFRDDILKQLEKGNFSYNLSGTNIKFPRKHLLLLKHLLDASFAILDLLPHDRDQ